MAPVTGADSGAGAATTGASATGAGAATATGSAMAAGSTAGAAATGVISAGATAAVSPAGSAAGAAGATAGLAGAAALAAGVAQAQMKTIAIGTGGTGGVYYPIGGALANLLSKNMPNMQATAQVTGGSVDNLKLIGSGQSEIGFSMADAAVDALGQHGDLQQTLQQLAQRRQPLCDAPTVDSGNTASNR